MSIEQIAARPDSLAEIIFQAELPVADSNPVSQETLKQRRDDQLFNLSGRATGLNRLSLDARQGLRGLVMRYNVANE